MRGKVAPAVAGLLVLTLVIGNIFLSCGNDDDDASMATGDEEDVSPTPFLQDDDQSDDDQTDDDDDDDNNDDDTTPDDDDDDNNDDDDNTPDPECVAAYEQYYECYPIGLGGYTMEEFIIDHCYGSPDEVYGPDGGLVQCYLEDPECRAFGICVAHLTDTADPDCIAAYERYYECDPAGFGIYTLEEMIWDNCWGGLDPKYGEDGYVVQCYLEYPTDCTAYVLCVDETLFFRKTARQTTKAGPQCLAVFAAAGNSEYLFPFIPLQEEEMKR